MPIPRRRPVKMFGSAPGRMTLTKTCARVAPRSWAALRSSGLIDFTPVTVLMRTRKRTPTLMVTIFDESPSPNHKRKSGKSADFGIG